MEDEVLNVSPKTETENPKESVCEETAAEKPRERKSFKEWWSAHKPSKRRLIQVYAALLYNANIKGYITGDIFKGNSKYACVPGLNCYSCPGAVGACPLGALQNALAGSDKRAPYYVFGIIMLFGLILGRLICGFLCPVGLAQDLLYKVKTPKIGKSRVTKVLSYLKYVILAILVIGIPVVYALDQTVVPGFCKYICPAGTFGGAFLLLINKNNESMFSMLGPLFTWKTVVLFAIIALCIFIYRAFCRFLCPLGAIYGLFNRFSILGIKVNDDKCTKCGKCVRECKMDIKKVGDHECINCGECIGVCPTKAITWKGSKLVVNNIDESVKPAAKPVAAEELPAVVVADTVECKSLTVNSVKKVRDRAFWLKLTAIILMAALFVGVFVYANFFESKPAEAVTPAEATFLMCVTTQNDEAVDYLEFSIGSKKEYVVPKSGSGTKDDPYVIEDVEGLYEPTIGYEGAHAQEIYFLFVTTEEINLEVKCPSDNLSLTVHYIYAGSQFAAYNYINDGGNMKLTTDKPEGFGNKAGDLCYDFTLDTISGGEKITLSDYRGKIVVINFWGTTCGPCVEELPEFEELRAAYDDVEIIAINRISDREGADGFLVSKGWDEWGIIFVQDVGNGSDGEIYTLLGGRNNSYPRTLVLNEEGVIAATFEGKISYQALEKAILSCK